MYNSMNREISYLNLYVDPIGIMEIKPNIQRLFNNKD